MQKTGQHQTFYEEIKCFINSLKAISSILEKLLLYGGEKIEIFSCQNSNKLPTIMFIRQGDNFKTISFIFQTRDNRKLPPSALLEFLDLRNCWTPSEFQLCNKFWKIVGILFWAGSHSAGSPIVKFFMTRQVSYTIRTVLPVRFQGCMTLNSFMALILTYEPKHDF